MKDKLRQHQQLAMGIVALLVAVGILIGFIVVRNHRAVRISGEAFGIDVSSHNGLVNWKKVSQDNIEFVYIKSTEGSTYIDPRFAKNWSGAKSAGLKRGAYHFFGLCSSGADQAKSFLHIVHLKNSDLAPALDLELADNCPNRPPQAEVLSEVNAFLTAVEKVSGKPTVIYEANDFENQYHLRDSLKRPLWQLQTFHPSTGQAWAIWQISSFMTINGINGSVDLDVMRRAQW